jgi:hypothetical protein
MPRVFTVVLPRHVRPVFSDRCIVCGTDRPETSTKVIARDNLEGRRIWAGWFAVRVPCCRLCVLRLGLWRIWDMLRTLLIGGGAFAFAFLYMLPRGYEGWVCGVTTLGLCAVGFSAVFIWNRIFPPAFNVDPHASTVDYEFRDRQTWEEFARLNGAEDAK